MIEREHRDSVRRFRVGLVVVSAFLLIALTLGMFLTSLPAPDPVLE
jgi:hypothetical protein